MVSIHTVEEVIQISNPMHLFVPVFSGGVKLVVAHIALVSTHIEQVRLKKVSKISYFVRQDMLIHCETHQLDSAKISALICSCHVSIIHIS